MDNMVELKPSVRSSIKTKSPRKSRLEITPGSVMEGINNAKKKTGGSLLNLKDKK